MSEVLDFNADPRAPARLHASTLNVSRPIIICPTWAMKKALTSWNEHIPFHPALDAGHRNPPPRDSQNHTSLHVLQANPWDCGSSNDKTIMVKIIVDRSWDYASFLPSVPWRIPPCHDQFVSQRGVKVSDTMPRWHR
jgi:hypothetical protein